MKSVVFVFLSIFITTLLSAQDKPVTGFRGNSTHTGLFNDPGIKGKIKWSFQTNSQITSSAIVCNDVIFFCSGKTLYALNTVGEKMFETPVKAKVNCTPVISGNNIYFYDNTGNAYCVNMESGQIIWEKKIFTAPYLSLYDHWDYYDCSPAVSDSTLYFGAPDGYLYAVNMNDGSVMWSFRTENIIRSSPVFHDGHIFFGSFDGRFYCLNAHNGSEIWRYEIKEYNYSRHGEIQSSPAIENGRVYFGSRNAYLFCLDEITGKEIWKYQHDGGSWVIASPAVSDSLVYCGSSDAHFVNCIDARSGSEVWRAQTVSNVFSSPAISADRLYFAEGNAYSLSEKSTVYSLDIKTGKQIWQLEFPSQIWSSPVIYKGLLLFGCTDGKLYAIE